MTDQSVGVIGVGRLGSDVAFALAERDLGDIALYDLVPDKAEYLASDLTDTSFGHVYSRRVTWTPRLRDLASCDVVLLAAGARLTPDTSVADVLRANRALVAEIAQAFVGSSSLFVVASEPMDLMTMELRRALKLPASRVLGIGGVVDSYRVRHAIGEELSMSPDFIRSHVIGPHWTQSSAPVVLWDYSSVNGMPLQQLADEQTRQRIEETLAQEASNRLRHLQESYSRYAPAMACLELIRAIVKDDRRILSVTVEWNKLAGISDVAMSAPCIIGRFGAERAIEPTLDSDEVKRLAADAEALRVAQRSASEEGSAA